MTAARLQLEDGLESPLAHARELDTLMVIIPDRLSALINKGEVTARYYNPGNLFRKVHIVMTNDDRPDPARMRMMAGDAELRLHNLPSGPRLFAQSLGWQPLLMRSWIDRGVALAREINPSMIRTHNNFLEGYLAAEIRRRLGVPYVTSLHGVWDRDQSSSQPLKEIIIRLFRKKLEARALRDAAAAIAVYKPIIRYAQKLGAKDTRLIYNVVSDGIEKKKSYRLASPPRLITVNRQVREKNPENIIRAIKEIDCVYTIVGDGPLHQHLRDVARKSGVADRVHFIRAMPNADLCRLLAEQDLMVSHCDYWGLSKTVIEAALAGLPTVLNHHPTEPIPDCEGDWLRLCDNTPESYREAIGGLLNDHDSYAALGQRAYAHGQTYFDPVAMERATVALYREVIGNNVSRNG